MKAPTKFAFAVLIALVFVFASTTVFLLVNQEVSESDQQEEREPVEFLTDKTTYESGENITFILLNNGTDGIGYTSSLRETLHIFDPWGGIAVMRPYIWAGTTVIQPGENLSWTWNQTYYLYVWEEGKLEPTWDYRSWTQVPNGKYVAEISYGDIKKEVEFWIGN